MWGHRTTRRCARLRGRGATGVNELGQGVDPSGCVGEVGENEPGVHDVVAVLGPHGLVEVFHAQVDIDRCIDGSRSHLDCVAIDPDDAASRHAHSQHPGDIATATTSIQAARLLRDPYTIEQ